MYFCPAIEPVTEGHIQEGVGVTWVKDREDKWQTEVHKQHFCTFMMLQTKVNKGSHEKPNSSCVVASSFQTLKH